MPVLRVNFASEEQIQMFPGLPPRVMAQIIPIIRSGRNVQMQDVDERLRKRLPDDVSLDFTPNLDVVPPVLPSYHRQTVGYLTPESEEDENLTDIPPTVVFGAQSSQPQGSSLVQQQLDAAAKLIASAELMAEAQARAAHLHGTQAPFTEPVFNTSPHTRAKAPASEPVYKTLPVDRKTQSDPGQHDPVYYPTPAFHAPHTPRRLDLEEPRRGPPIPTPFDFLRPDETAAPALAHAPGLDQHKHQSTAELQMQEQTAATTRAYTPRQVQQKHQGYPTADPVLLPDQNAPPTQGYAPQSMLQDQGYQSIPSPTKWPMPDQSAPPTQAYMPQSVQQQNYPQAGGAHQYGYNLPPGSLMYPNSQQIRRCSALKDIPRTMSYDGKANWRSWHMKFVQYAVAYQWTEEDCKTCLIHCLMGKALDHCTRLLQTNPSLSYRRLVDKLDSRFGAELQASAQAKFNIATQNKGESIEDWSDRVQDLATIAFREVSESYANRQTIDRFCQGLSDVDAGHSVFMRKFDSIEQAMNEIRLYQHSRKSMVGDKHDPYSASNYESAAADVCAVQMKRDQDQQTASNVARDIADLKEQLSKLTFRSRRPTRQSDRSRSCYVCGDTTHLARECPKRHVDLNAKGSGERTESRPKNQPTVQNQSRGK